MYFAVTSVPFLSTRLTVTPLALPVNCGSGVNVTTPFSSIVYVPSPGTSFVVEPSSNVGLTVSSISTVTSLPLTVVLPGVNTGVPVCLAPCTSSDTTSSDFGVTGLTVGVYLAVAGVPFVSLRCTSIPCAFPVKFGSGLNVTSPVSGLIV